MSTVSTIKKHNLIKINHKKKKIQRNRKIIAIGILLLTLFIIGTSIKICMYLIDVLIFFIQLIIILLIGKINLLD